jgi:hypothetical protein
MNILPADQELPFEVSYAPGLFVGMQVIDYSTEEPVPVGSVIPMLADEVGSSLYVGLFTPLLGKTYVVKKNVYTDGTYTTIDSSGNYSQGSESFIALNTVQQILVQNLKIMIGCQQQPRQRPVIVAINSDQTILLSFFDEWENPVDITGVSELEMSFLESDNETVLTKSLGSGITLVGGKINQALVTFHAADVELLNPGYNDAQIAIALDGLDYAINAYGAMNVQPSVLVAP